MLEIKHCRCPGLGCLAWDASSSSYLEAGRQKETSDPVPDNKKEPNDLIMGVAIGRFDLMRIVNSIDGSATRVGYWPRERKWASVCIYRYIGICNCTCTYSGQAPLHVHYIWGMR